MLGDELVGRTPEKSQTLPIWPSSKALAWRTNMSADFRTARLSVSGVPETQPE